MALIWEFHIAYLLIFASKRLPVVYLIVYIYFGGFIKRETSRLRARQHTFARILHAQYAANVLLTYTHIQNAPKKRFNLYILLYLGRRKKNKREVCRLFYDGLMILQCADNHLYRFLGIWCTYTVAMFKRL